MTKTTRRKGKLLWLNRLLTAEKDLPTSFLRVHGYYFQSLKKSRIGKTVNEAYWYKSSDLFFLWNVKPHHLLFYMNNLQSQTVYHVSMGGKRH